MPPLAEYRLVSAPRFASDEMDARLYDSFLSQRALWSHLAMHLVGRHGATVEYRVSLVGNEITAALRVHGEPTDVLLKQIAEVEAMLPPGYRWHRVAPCTRYDAMPLRMARIVRRLEYVDLPVPARTMERRGGRRSLFGGKEIDERDQRRIPEADTALGELHHERFCLPLPGPIDDLKPRQRVLFQEFQRFAPGPLADLADDDVPLLLSICLHPPNPTERYDNQLLALGWKRFLDHFVGELASAGFSDMQNLQSAYSRFSLPPGYLAHLSLRVAGQSDSAVVGLANMVAASYGGFRAFEVLRPTREVPGSSLVEARMDVPGLWRPRQLTQQRRLLRDMLLIAEIAPVEDDAVADFLLRLPHLFTIQEIENLVRLPVADEEGLPGLDTEVMPPFAAPSLKLHPVRQGRHVVAPPPAGRLRIGIVKQPGSVIGASDPLSSEGWHHIDPVDLTKHAFITGSTGSGKTMSTLFLVRELARLKIPTLIIEPVKTEYYARLKDKLPKLRRLRFEGDADGNAGADFLAFDPMRIPAGIGVLRHISYIKSCFEAAFPMPPLLALLLESALYEYYTAPPPKGCGYRPLQRGGPHLGAIRKGQVFPSFQTFKSFVLEDYIKRAFPANASGSGQAMEFREAFRRRFENLDKGILGISFKAADAIYRHSAKRDGVPRSKAYDLLGQRLLRGNVVLELDAIADAEQKALVMAFVLTYVFEYRQAEDFLAREAGGSLPAGLRHFLIVEEAHRLLSNTAAHNNRDPDTAGASSSSKAISLFVDMLAEIRAFGQGLAIVEQIPTKIASEAVKNTNLKIMLRLTASDDRDYLGEAMNFTPAQKRFVTNLRVERPRDRERIAGQVNFVIFEEGVEQPLLLALPLTAQPPQGSDWLYDEYFEETP